MPYTGSLVGPSLELPAATSLKFWQDEIERAERTAKSYHMMWDENVQWYTGRSPDALAMLGKNVDFVNVNVDFYQVEQKMANLFYETPELQLTGTGIFAGTQAATIVHAHKTLLNAILGDSHMDILPTVHLAIKDCLCVSGTGAVILGYQPTIREVQPPQQLGTILGLQQPVKVPIHEKFYAEYFSAKKFLHPADFKSTDWDHAPWLGMRFRMPFTMARREFPSLPPTFTGTTTRDEHVLDSGGSIEEATSQIYIDGQLIWYRATYYDDQPVHPEQYRELVLIDGLDQPARHRDSPHQTLDPKGRMTADSLLGNPIHPLTIRTVPDSSFVPSDSLMTRPLVRELCKFRTQMVQQRDANRSRILYDIGAFPPEVLAAIEDGTLGTLIGLEPGKLTHGISTIMAEVVKANASRDNYTANDYIQRDIEKTLAISANAVGQNDPNEGSATQTAIVDRSSQARQAHEQRQVLRWYLKLVDKVSALTCRYLLPPMVVPYIGEEAANVWGQWNKQTIENRLTFSARPDSQIRLDAAAERKFALDVYNFTAQDPNANRVPLLENLHVKAGLDPTKTVVQQLPEKKPEPSVGFSFKGDDFIGPQAPIVIAICQQLGLEIPQEAQQAATEDLATQIVTGARDMTGEVIKQPAEHGGPAEKIRPLSKQQGERSGERTGPKVSA